MWWKNNCLSWGVNMESALIAELIIHLNGYGKFMLELKYQLPDQMVTNTFCSYLSFGADWVTTC